jgi:H+/Cl- antiporter ClcA
MIATKICICLSSPIQLQILVYRFVLSSIYIGGGSPLGIEAPTFHLCAALASNLNPLKLITEVIRNCKVKQKLKLRTDIQ